MKNSLKCLIVFALILQGILSESVITKEDLNDFCNGVNEREFEFNESQTLPEYIESLDLGDQSHDSLDYYLTNDKVPPIPDILREMFLVIVIGIFIIVAILTWVGFWICCCKGCCAFKKAKISNGKKCCTFVLTFALFVVTIAASIGAFATSTNFVKDLNSLTCSFAKFYYHTEFGEDKTNETTSRWIGLDAIVNMAENTKNVIDEISKETGTFDGLEQVNVKASDYNDGINDLDKYGNLKIIAPNEFNETEISPMYALEFLYNNTEEETYLSKIRKEFNENLNNSVPLLNILKFQVEGIKDQSEDLKTTMDQIKENVSNLKTSINNIGNKVFTAVKDYKGQANSLGYKFFKILFGMFIAFAVILLVILFINSCCKCIIFKWLLFLVWNALLIFMVLAFTVAAIFEVFTEVTYQIAPATSHIFSYEFLANNTKFQVSEESAELLDICLNKDGNIADKLLGEDSKTSDAIDGLYKIMDNLKQINIKTESEAINYAQEGMQNYKDDYSLATTIYNTDPKIKEERVSEQLSNLTFMANEMYLEDQFNAIESQCPPGSNIVKTLADYQQTGVHCMLIQYLTPELFDEIYSTKSLYPAMKPKFDALKAFYEKEQEQVDEIQNDLTTIDTKYSDTASDTFNIKEKADKLSQGFLEVYEPIMGEGGFRDIFTCRFIKKDLISFMDIIFHEFKDDCKAICIGTFVAALASYVGLYFLLITVFRHGKHKKSDDDYEKM